MGSASVGHGKDDSDAKSESGGDEELKPGKDSSQFAEGDKVLAYHGLLIYEAKIQRAEFRKKEWKYFVHYLGWNKNWDEWVGTERLMTLTEANLEKQRKLFKSHNGEKNKGRVSQAKKTASTDVKAEKEEKTPVGRGKKRKSDSMVEEKEKEAEEPDQVMKIPMPGTLKKRLVDEWEFITQMGKLIKLPRSPCVDEILKRYLEFRSKRDNGTTDSLVEILNGLRSYFDKALPAMLLYRQEREQYAEAVPEDSPIAPSFIYGAEHLLRLFVKIPELLAYTNMEEEALTQLQQKLTDFLKYLQKNQSSFFLSTYDGAKPEGGKKETKS